jgi:hypothetical protein
MSEDVQVRSGWGDTRAERISAPTLQRIAAADREQARADALAERDRQLMREQAAADAFRASVEAAVERGESIDPRQAHRTAGSVTRRAVRFLAWVRGAAGRRGRAGRGSSGGGVPSGGRRSRPRRRRGTRRRLARWRPRSSTGAARANADRAIREGEVLRRAAGVEAERTARRVAHQGDVRLAGRLVERGVL